ncbi:MAG: hypothetical protein HOP21_08830 [Methylotenera sp.]|nr:hypothetical protein [Methylotenera sp.]
MTKNRSLFSAVIVIIGALVILVAHADSNTFEQRKILPYLEAEGEVPSFGAASMVWLNSEKIIFTTFASSESYRREELADKVIHHFDAGSQVVTFNVNTKMTEFYKKGKFFNLKDGVITIVLKDVIVKGASSENYKELLKGPLGNEVSETYYQEKQMTKPIKQCPNDNEPLPTPPQYSLAQPLKAEHGCIRESFSQASFPRAMHYTYFRVDGQKIELEMPTYDELGPYRWIDWLNAYLFGDSVTMDISNSRDQIPINTATVKLLSPLGGFKLVEMGEFGFTKVRPTRAGMVAAKNLPESGAFGPRNNGLYLWQGRQKQQITEGNVDNAEVSPDGCKVAYCSRIRNVISRKIQNCKLRVIDVCEGFGVNNDANPFK